jgi:hypothetical protein
MTRVEGRVRPDRSRLEFAGNLAADVDGKGIFVYAARYGTNKDAVCALIEWLEYWIADVDDEVKDETEDAPQTLGDA